MAIREQNYLNKIQAGLLQEFAGQVLGSPSNVRRIKVSLIGSEDLNDRERSVALIEALQREDWSSVKSHQAVAGLNNIVVAIAAQIDGQDGSTSDYWVAMRSPYELMDSPEIIAYGKTAWPPEIEFALLWEKQ